MIIFDAQIVRQPEGFLNIVWCVSPVERSRQLQKIRCPFHWWTYDLNGRLKVYPRMEKALDFNPDDYGLIELRVACQVGFAFICLDQQTEELDTWLGDFSNLHIHWEPD